MILVCGEALFDMIGTPIDGEQFFRPVVGGSPLNVAFGLARLGRPAAFLSKLSTDYFGRRLEAFMVGEGLDLAWLVRAPELQSTLAFVALGADGQPVYSFYGTGAADRSMVEADVPASLPDAVNAIHFGSIALAQEPTATTLLGFMRRMAPTRVIAVDPNIRPTIIADRALWLSRFDAMLTIADVVKASAEDVEWIVGPDADIAATARDWSRRGPAFVVVTDGGRGAVVARDGSSRFAPARPVVVADTVGAGDTFQAAMLARLDEHGLLTKAALRGLDDRVLDEVVAFAATAAAITCTRHGADLPRRAEVAAALGT